MAFYVVEVDNDGFKVYDSAGNAIDPAKDASVTALGTILTAIKNTDGIKKIVDALPAGTNNIGDVDVLSSALPTGASTEATLLLIKAKTDNIPSDPAREGGKLTSLETILTAIKNTDGIKKIVDALPAGDNVIGRAKLTDGTNVLVVESGGQGRVLPYAPDRGGTVRAMNLVQDDLESTLYRLAVTGKVSITVPPPPPGGTKVTITADNPLIVSQAISPHLTEWTIPDGKTLYIQQIIAGCQGDPSADGSKVEVYYYNGTTQHLIDRIYILGQTQFGNYPDTNMARDGTTFVGVGTARKIRIYRYRMSNSSQEIDSVIRGYTI